MARIDIYTTPLCGFCAMAKRLLDAKGVGYAEFDVMGDRDRRAEMIRRAGGARSVPQIFIDGALIGGCDELHALDRAGGLDPLLAQ